MTPPFPARWSWARAGVVVGLAVWALLGWQGVTTVVWGEVDSGEHVLYAQFLDDHHRIPTVDENYEYATPPLFHLVAIGAEHTVRALPAKPLELSSNALTRALWLVLVGAGAAAMTTRRRGVRIAGLASLVCGALWGLDEIVAVSRTIRWSAGEFLVVAASAALAGVTALLALEAWPARRGRALGAVGVLLAYPVFYRMAILFHPELPLALWVAVALLLVMRAERQGWPTSLGAATGVACAAAAWTRQSAAVVIVCLLVAAAVAGGRGAARYIATCSVAIALIAGPWWGYASYLWRNPLQSNLDRPGLMLDHQPRSFYVSFPVRALVVHPWREDFNNELLPKLHADLWSDWFLAMREQTGIRLDRITLQVQSVLGFFGDALALGGLAFVGGPCAWRVVRRRSSGADFPLGLLAFVALGSFIAYVVTLIRLPQDQGDPIKSSYLLFTAPCWAILSVAAWLEVKRRSAIANAVLVAVACLYVVNYALYTFGVFYY